MSEWLLLLTEVQCEQATKRAAIECSEQYNFSRLVSLRIFERHGAWNLADESDELRRICHNCGTPCPFCSEKESIVSIWKRLFELHGRKIKTPCCTDEELSEGDGCQQGLAATEVLRRRHEFYKQEGQLLLRIQKASDSIRCHR